MVDRAEAIKQVVDLLVAKHRERQAADGGGDAEFDESAFAESIEAVLQEIFADFEGDLSAVPEDELAQMIDEFVGLAIEQTG